MGNNRIGIKEIHSIRFTALDFARSLLPSSAHDLIQSASEIEAYIRTGKREQVTGIASGGLGSGTISVEIGGKTVTPKPKKSTRKR